KRATFHRIVLKHEQRIEQLAQSGLRLDLGQPDMRVRLQQRLALLHLPQYRPQPAAGRQLHPQRQGVDQQPHHVRDPGKLRPPPPAAPSPAPAGSPPPWPRRCSASPPVHGPAGSATPSTGRSAHASAAPAAPAGARQPAAPAACPPPAPATPPATPPRQPPG